MQAAKTAGVPNDTIDRAVKRASGEDDSVQYEEITYEGYAPGGVAVLVRTLTDNKNRTAAEVRHVFTKCNGNLGGANSVAYLFNEKGIITLPKTAVSEDKLYEVALDAGATDINDGGDEWEVITAARDYPTVREAIEKLYAECEGEVRMVPDTYVNVAGRDAELVVKMMDLLDDLDDAQWVVGNFEISEADMERLS